MNAILIARVSTEEQKEAGNSLPAQVERIEKYCRTKNFTIIKSFSFDESAYKNTRESFDQILDYIINQTEKVVVCCDKVDRLSRNIFDKRVSILYEKALCDRIELHFVSDGQVINSRISAVEKFQFNISLGLAKYYSDAISDNVRRAMEQKLRKGEWIAKAPYGYKNIVLEGDKKDLIVDEYASQIVKKAFELYATETYSMETLADKLKSDHCVDWSVSYIDKVFNNHFYYGIMVIKGNSYAHKYPPIITKELFDQVQKAKARFNKKRYKVQVRHPYVYRGMFKCSDCGLAITPERQKGFVYYHCTEYKGKHDAKWLREEVITEQLGNVFKNMKMPKEIAEQIIETMEESNKNKIEFYYKQFGVLDKEQKMVTKMLDNLYMDKLKGSITDSEYDKFYQRFKEQLNDISSKLDQLEKIENDYIITTRYLLKLADQAHDLFMSSEVDEKRQLINLVLSNLKIEGENVVFDLQTPFDIIVKCSEYQVWRP